MPEGGTWEELLNSDAEVYGGSGMGNLGGVEAEDQPWHGFALAPRPSAAVVSSAPPPSS